MTVRAKPAENLDTKFFWDGARGGLLLIQQCAECSTFRHPPRPMCPACNSLRWEAVESSGKGVVHSYVIPHHPKLPGFEEPYVVALVDLPEGVRMVSNVRGIAPSAVTNGMEVELFFETFDDDVTLPQFRPAKEARR